MKLTDTTVETLACPVGKKDVLVFDAAEPGFGVRVTSAGKRVFLFQYRDGTTKRRQRIGTWGEGKMTCAKARKEAERMRGEVNAGSNPVVDRRAAKVAERTAEVAAKAQAAADAFTFPKLVDEWEKRGIAHRRPRYREDATKRLRAYFKAWDERPAAGITRAEVVRAVDEIEKQRGTTSARRGLAYARACYGWAVKRDLLASNPFQGIAAPGKENPRDRVLTNQETGAIWRAASSLGNVLGPYVRVLLLTLQRREEVARMRWEELAPDLSLWTLPAERTKNGRAHVVHLAEPARELIASIPRIKGSPWVFPGRADGPVAAFSYMKEELVRAMRKERGAPEAGAAPKRATASTKGPKRPRAAVVRRQAPEDAWRFHDFRRTGVTALADMGIPPHVADKLLNHVTGSIQGVAAVYQRAEFLPERKRAIEAWAAHVLSCAEGRPAGSNVVPLKAA